MKIEELHGKALLSDELVLDVRDADEFSEGHLAGARNIPADDVVARADELRAELGKYRAIYVHCGGGGRAGRASEALTNAGLKNVVHIYESGMRSWLAAGYPTVR